MAGFWNGLGPMLQKATQAGFQVREGAGEGIGLALRNVLNVSNAQVPHETGALMQDGKIGVESEGLRGGVGYGSDPEVAKYAVRQHEDMELKHDSGRNAKFLENAFNSTREQSLQIIGQSIKSRMGSA